MIKLLKAGLFRVKKDNILYIFIILTCFIAIFTIAKNIPNREIQFDKLVNTYIMYIGLLIAIFISIFVGKEYSQGIIRNKIIVGHNRKAIYLVNLIISIIVSIFCEMIYFLLIFIVGNILHAKMELSLSQYLMSILNTCLVIISFCSIYNFISMICKNITVSTVLCIILFILMFIGENAVGLTAFSRRYIEHSMIDENGNKYIISQEINPNYPGDQKVKIAKIIYLLIPQGQAMEIANNDFELMKQMPIYSIILIIFINIFGIFIFSKKELK